MAGCWACGRVRQEEIPCEEDEEKIEEEKKS
jgi:hypothetical protein